MGSQVRGAPSNTIKHHRKKSDSIAIGTGVRDIIVLAQQQQRHFLFLLDGMCKHISALPVGAQSDCGVTSFQQNDQHACTACSARGSLAHEFIHSVRLPHIPPDTLMQLRSICADQHTIETAPRCSCAVRRLTYLRIDPCACTTC